MPRLWWVLPVTAVVLWWGSVILRGRRRYREGERQDTVKLTDERRTMLLDAQRRQDTERR